MGDINKAKQVVLDGGEKIKLLLSNTPHNQENINLFSVLNSVVQNMKEVLYHGSEDDKKDVLVAMGKILQLIDPIYQNMLNTLGIVPEKMMDFVKQNSNIDVQKLKEFQKLGEDLKRFAAQADK
ncbi:MAG: hypothetical protein FJZ63_07445 [Chlamydiae bacterium]|nr:hypothetical protein [Chlamydiota bacterium]